MTKVCKICGKNFEPKQEHFEICFNCYKTQPKREDIKNQLVSSNLLLNSYFDSNGNIVREVFIDVPKQISLIFNKDNLKIKQLRDFYQIISKARKVAMMKGIDDARQILWQCKTQLEYQKKRGVIPQSFFHFMEHNLNLAEKDEKHLDAFYHHLDSIVCYFPKE